RVLLTWRLIQAYGLVQLPNVMTVSPAPADDATIELVHTREFVEATRAAGHGEDGPWGRFGYGPGDNPIFDRMHEAAAVVVGASVAAAQVVWSGEVEHAFNASGGLHHAMPGRASGFCVYDDPAVAIAWLLEHGATRIAYVDVDVHHGDGPQAIFYDDPRVLTVSIHQKAPWFFPGTGGRAEMGGPDARGSALNVPLAPGPDDDGWLDAFRDGVLPAVEAFDPEVLVTQLGCDTHTTDPLAQLDLTTRAYREAARDLHRLAHRSARGRWIATGGGGYQWATVVPRAWTTYFAEMSGALVDLSPELPAEFLDEVRRLAGPMVPDRLDAP
ncbi:MAG: acetoin utilization protein AcuC, partial [Actinomycetota bacterium]|nr:acetoin utilization protein AcuC [Actinomycetota bacterium]